MVKRGGGGALKMETGVEGSREGARLCMVCMQRMIMLREVWVCYEYMLIIGEFIKNWELLID
jgi:hypothetical protein